MKEIEYRGIKLLVTGTYEPPEEQVRYYDDMSGYPGSNADFIIDKIFVENTNIYDLFSVMDLEEIVELVLEEICLF